jgi:Bifunctional DNA primase/polymerase, N-terminal
MKTINLAINRGLSIHPVKSRGKEPLLNRWPEMATSDPRQIEAWQQQFPGCNYGVAASDDVCILESDDVDTLRDKLSRQLPQTYTVQARPNRPHIYFRQTAESRAAGNLDLPGIFEFKQRNRYVVAEGSIHPTGAAYTCIVDAPIVEIPAWLVADLVRLRAGSGTRMSAPLPADGRKYGEGEGRHPMLMSQAAKLWDGEKSFEEMFEALQTLNEQYCDPPKEAHKLVGMIEWVMSREPVTKGPTLVLGKPKLQAPPVRRTAYDFVLGPLAGEKHGVFALGSLHLIQGSSGNGKTTLALQMLKAQRERAEVFGRPGTGREYLVVWQDRSQQELERQLDAMGMLEDPPPYVVVDGSKPPAQTIEEIYQSRDVKPEAMLVEGLDMWSEDAKDMKHVSTLATAVRSVGEHFHISIIGTVGQPKMKPKEQYTAPRDRAFGSSAWARKADTIMDITMDQETQIRHVQLLLRTGKAQHMEFEFRPGSGLLHPRQERLVPKIVVGEEKELTVRALAGALHIGKNRAAELLRQVGQNGARELLRQAEVADTAVA